MTPASNDVKPGFTRLYLSQTEAAELLHLSRNHLARLIKDGLFLPPDVWVAKYLYGWDEDRLRDFGQDVGLIDAQGNKLRDLAEFGDPEEDPAAAVRDRLKAEYDEKAEALKKRQAAQRKKASATARVVLAEEHRQQRKDLAARRREAIRGAKRDHIARILKKKYQQPTRLYLGSALAAAVWGHEPSSTSTARHRNRFIPADVVVSTRFGWDEQRVIDEGLRTGRLDEIRLDEWAVERTTEHGLPTAYWVRKRAKERRTLAEALKSAGVDYS